jgi:hypothetical protein
MGLTRQPRTETLAQPWRTHDRPDEVFLRGYGVEIYAGAGEPCAERRLATFGQLLEVPPKHWIAGIDA